MRFYSKMSELQKNKKMMDLKKKSAILLEQKENRTIFAP